MGQIIKHTLKEWITKIKIKFKGNGFILNSRLLYTVGEKGWGKSESDVGLYSFFEKQSIIVLA